MTKKYVRVRWNGWDWIAFTFNEKILQECLEDGSIQSGDAVYEIKKQFTAVADKPQTVKLKETSNGDKTK